MLEKIKQSLSKKAVDVYVDDDDDDDVDVLIRGGEEDDDKRGQNFGEQNKQNWTAKWHQKWTRCVKNCLVIKFA